MTYTQKFIKLVAISLVVTGIILIAAGCCSSQRIVEGTSLQLGAYIPYSENLYGVELMSYVNGIKVNVSSNSNMKVSRTHSSTNNWAWGLLETVEFSNTKVEVETK